MNKITFYSKDGIKLVGIWHLPIKSTQKVVILTHGITVDKDEDGMFKPLAEKLQNTGFATFRFDFRGHGESGGKSTEMTVTGEVNDLEAAVSEAVNKGYKEIGLLGASFGGGSSVLYASKNQNKLKALCLWNPVLNYDHFILNPTLPWLIKRKGHMKNDIKSQGWTTIGSRKYKIGKNLWEEMGELYPFKELQSIKIPTVILHTPGDTYVPYKDSKEYIKNVGKLVTISGGGHGFHDKPFDKEAIDVTLNFFQTNL